MTWGPSSSRERPPGPGTCVDHGVWHTGSLDSLGVDVSVQSTGAAVLPHPPPPRGRVDAASQSSSARPDSQARPLPGLLLSYQEKQQGQNKAGLLTHWKPSPAHHRSRCLPTQSESQALCPPVTSVYTGGPPVSRPLFRKRVASPGWVAQLAGTPSCTPKGFRFDPQSGAYRRQLIDVSLSH